MYVEQEDVYYYITVLTDLVEGQTSLFCLPLGWRSASVENDISPAFTFLTVIGVIPAEAILFT
jgi:hypothetical protein